MERLPPLNTDEINIRIPVEHIKFGSKIYMIHLTEVFIDILPHRQGYGRESATVRKRSVQTFYQINTSVEYILPMLLQGCWDLWVVQ